MYHVLGEEQGRKQSILQDGAGIGQNTRVSSAVGVCL